MVAAWFYGAASLLLGLYGQYRRSNNHGQLQVPLCFGTKLAGLGRMVDDEVTFHLPAWKQLMIQIKVDKGMASEDDDRCFGMAQANPIKKMWIDLTWREVDIGDPFAILSDLEHFCERESGIKKARSWCAKLVDWMLSYSTWCLNQVSVKGCAHWHNQFFSLFFPPHYNIPIAFHFHFDGCDIAFRRKKIWHYIP